MSQARLEDLTAEIAGAMADKAIDAALCDVLDAAYPASGETFTEIEALCGEGEAQGWLCAREAGGIRFGRIVKPGTSAGRFSVDVVRMEDIKGPHHRHPQGEIGMIMPIAGAAKFDGMGRGWYVQPPGSAHSPTVTGGSAYVLYFLPDGDIEFTGK